MLWFNFHFFVFCFCVWQYVLVSSEQQFCKRKIELTDSCKNDGNTLHVHVSSQQRWTEIFPARTLKLMNKLTALWEYNVVQSMEDQHSRNAVLTNFTLDTKAYTTRACTVSTLHSHWYPKISKYSKFMFIQQ